MSSKLSNLLLNSNNANEVRSLMAQHCKFVAIIAMSIVSFTRMTAADQPQDVSELLMPLVEKHKVPALAAAVIEGERLTKLGAAGIRARGDEAKVELDDLWHLGSCTKAMTATLCARLVEQGKLKWDSKVGDVFTDQAEPIHAEWRDVTLVQLLSHRASLPSIPPLPLWLKLVGHDGSRDAREMLLSGGWLKSAPAAAPGSKWEYSNAGFMLAGLMAERAANKDWETLMRELLFEPLGMKSAGFGAPGSADKVDQPRGHNAFGFAMKPGKGADNPRGLGPAGTVHCSLRDWSKFIALHLQAARGDCKLLTAESFHRLHAPQPIDDKTGYALGWIILERPWADGSVLMHNGSNTMWYSVVWIAPKRGFAVMAVTNLAGLGAKDGAAATDAVASLLIQKQAKPAKE